MKINEVCSPFKTYIATVRVVLNNGSTTARTTINAESSAHAYLMLNRLYGLGNVISLSEVINEAPQTEQIHAQLLFNFNQNRCSKQAPYRENAQIQPSQVTLQQRSPKRRRLSTKAIAAPIKHDLVQDMLTKQFMRQSNIVKPTSDDIRIAKSRAVTRLKRANLDLERASEEQARRHARQSTLKSSTLQQPTHRTSRKPSQTTF